EAFIVKGKLTGVTKVVLSLFISPILGFLVGWLLQKFVSFLVSASKPRVNKVFMWSQYISAAGMSFAHGTNDAQKSMGIVALALFLGGEIDKFYVPFWVIMACAVLITVGNMFGGWRIARTVGFGIFKVRAIHSFNAQMTGAAVIYGAALVGAPVSTTHVSNSAIMGVGTASAPRSVKWRKGKEMILTWFITIPGAGLVGGVTYLVVKAVLGIH
ncbi:MAG: inorganic phosphate transporter, partial [Magnetococcales bacterium]|nr:inorganic phosphate transporter [Magnetococcales bacterium]